MQTTAPSDQQLIENIQRNNCSDSVIMLSERHGGIVMQHAKKYSVKAPCSGNTLQDYGEEIPYIVYKAAQSYETDKNVKFVTWLGCSSRYYFLDRTKEKLIEHKGRLEDFNEFNEVCDSQQFDVSRNSFDREYIMQIASQMKDRRIGRIIDLMYYGETPLKYPAVAQKMGVSAHIVKVLHRKLLKLLKAKMGAEMFLDSV